jgi:SAM-dependent methyltransferase
MAPVSVTKANAFNIRIKPFLSHSGYLARKVNLRVFREFAARLSLLGTKPIVLDVGCGDKPFASLLRGVYHVGTDLFPSSAADVLADNAMLPVRDNSVDGVLASETLEHTFDYDRAIDEMIRVCKDGGLLFISVPFMHPIHNPPYDFQRFTSYRLMHAFRDHELILFAASNSIFTSWLITLGYGIKYTSFFFPFSNALTVIPQLLINSLTIAIEAAVGGIWKLLNAIGLRRWLNQRIDRKQLRGLWMAMPAGYALLISVRKNRGETISAGASIARSSPYSGGYDVHRCATIGAPVKRA